MPDDPWPNDRILYLWMDIHETLDVRPDEKFGAALWTVFSNNQRVIDPEGNVVDAGSFRGAGGMVAALCGGDYMDYYMSNYRADESLVISIRAYLMRRGFTLTDWDGWERGVLDGRYSVPSGWADYFERRRAGQP